MKRLRSHHEEYLEPVILYLDDLERIVGCLSEITGKIELSTDEYEFDNVNELEKLEIDSLHRLDIGNEKVHLRLAPFRVLLTCSDEPAPRGVCEKIKQILVSRKRKLAWFRHGWLFPIPITLLPWIPYKWNMWRIFIWVALGITGTFGVWYSF